MKNHLTSLETDDTVYIVFNKNFDNDTPAEYVIVKGYIVKNEKKLVEYTSSDYYDDSIYTRKEMYIEVTIGALGKKYHRYYTPNDCYDNGGYLPMHCDCDDYGPYIELYMNIEDAKNNYIERLSSFIQSSQEIISKESKRIEVYQNNLNSLKNI